MSPEDDRGEHGPGREGAADGTEDGTADARPATRAKEFDQRPCCQEDPEQDGGATDRSRGQDTSEGCCRDGSLGGGRDGLPVL